MVQIIRLADLAPGLNKTLLSHQKREGDRTLTQKPIPSTNTDMNEQGSVPQQSRYCLLLDVIVDSQFLSSHTRAFTLY
jgi:hypothetical protein